MKEKTHNNLSLLNALMTDILCTCVNAFSPDQISKSGAPYLREKKATHVGKWMICADRMLHARIIVDSMFILHQRGHLRDNDAGNRQAVSKPKTHDTLKRAHVNVQNKAQKAIITFDEMLQYASDLHVGKHTECAGGRMLSSERKIPSTSSSTFIFIITTGHYQLKWLLDEMRGCKNMSGGKKKNYERQAEGD